MPYCSKCGKQISESAKFCTSCGAPVQPVDDNTKRQSVYEGKIHKCPNCGQIVEAFQDDCPACGYQFRDTTVTSSVKELVDKLQEIENEPKNHSFSQLFSGDGLSWRTSKQVALINNYPIPNTYEDIWEFLILASSRIKNFRTDGPLSSDETALANAWRAKFDQAYHKAMLVIDTPEDIQRIKDLYSKTQTETVKNQRKRMTSIIVPLVFVFALFFVGPISLLIRSPGRAEYNYGVSKENERLNAIVEEVYDYIEQENYTMARVKAASLSFNFTSDYSSDYETVAEKWDKTREELLEIIDEAEQKAKAQTNMEGE